MKPEDRQLLLQDLCARLPYWVKVKVCYYYEYEDGTFKKYNEIKYFDAEIFDLLISGDRSLDDIKPYLRPMSSMTEEEKRELQSFFPGSFGNQWLDVEAGYIDIYECESTTRLYLYDANRLIDWLNKKMFDYRGLIPRGHALSTEAFNPY